MEFKHTVAKNSDANEQPKDAESKASEDSKVLSASRCTVHDDDDWDVLQQTMSRLLAAATLTLNSLLRVMVGFSITSRHCYVSVMKRWIDTSSKRHLHQKIIICKVNVTAARELWRNLSYLGEPSLYHLNGDDYITIHHTIKLLGYPPESCRIQLIGYSNSRVYGITLPGKFDLLSLGIEEGKIDSAIKICLDDRKGLQEIFCLRRVAESIPTTKSPFQNGSIYANFQFYARGAVDEDCIDWFDTNRKIGDTTASQLQTNTGEVWWQPPLDRDLLCQAIIMDYGLPLQPSQEYSEEILDDLRTSLYFIHNAGLVHCDIRRWNIMKFTTGWQLVDFDYARQVNGEIWIDLESNQYKACGPAVHSLDTSTIKPELNIRSYHWRIDDDYQMLFRLLQDRRLR